MAKCESCGKPLNDDQAFCPQCGTPVKKAPPAPKAAAAPPVPPATNCPKCGSPLAAGARFCGDCGNSLDAVPLAAASGSVPPPPGAAPGAPVPPATGAYPYPPVAPYGAYQPPSAVGDYLSFRKFLTPGLAQVLFWLFEALSLLFWITFIVYFTNFASGTKALGIICGVIGLLVGAVAVRVIMEATMVLFHIHAKAPAE
jgi:hypothetical protein